MSAAAVVVVLVVVVVVVVVVVLVIVVVVVVLVVVVVVTAVVENIIFPQLLTNLQSNTIMFCKFPSTAVQTYLVNACRETIISTYLNRFYLKVTDWC
jgi:hypothetical protein